VYAGGIKHFYTLTTKISEESLLRSFALEKDSYFFWFSALRDRVELHVLRDFFLSFHGLPPHFDFAAYAREALNERILSVMEISLSSWILLCGMFVSNYIRLDKVPGAGNDHFTPVCDSGRRLIGVVRRLAG
jgi:hypothetical protein